MTTARADYTVRVRETSSLAQRCRVTPARRPSDGWNYCSLQSLRRLICARIIVDVNGSPTRTIAMVCAGFLFVFGFKFLGMDRATAMMTPLPPRGDAPSAASQTPRTGGPAVYPPPDFVPPQPSSSRPHGLYPFIGRVPMESVGAGIALLAIAGGVTGAAWLGVLVLVVFSAGHTVVDWVAIAVLSIALVACHITAAVRSQPS